ncbi:hypothetical protein [Campylobacter taeniopygiae]|uniref:Helix-turn-helix domain-containing protein n=1 Tax=Campylobacter taeniopygiae TaxID=2510188 RepID=A0ABY2TIH6_9BACT|nr:hypothetical protein [Campylobacter taeniopygiae]TKX33802.1 hypothetical protein CQA75_05670 [Campylobacter taeniopygiae]
MLNWKKIEDLNLKEVVDKTQIELDFLNALIKKDFSTLHRFNVKGFIKILSREYDLDFTDFNEEYEAYLNENNLNTIKNNNIKIATPKLDAYHQKSTNFGVLIVLCIVAIILALGIYYFDAIKVFFKNEQNNSSPAVVDIIGQAQNNLKSLESNVVVIDNKAKEKSDENTSSEIVSNEQDIQEQEQNITQNITQETDENTTIENNTTVEDVKPEEQNTPIESVNKNAYFKISTKTWIGVIELQKYKKTSFVKSQDFTLPLDTDQLILTGPSALSVIDENNKEHQFPIGNPKRFLIKDGKIKSISLSEFMKLNKGREW